MEEKILKLDPDGIGKMHYADDSYSVFPWNEQNKIIVNKINELIDAFNNRNVPFYLKD